MGCECQSMLAAALHGCASDLVSDIDGMRVLQVWVTALAETAVGEMALEAAAPQLHELAPAPSKIPSQRFGRPQICSQLCSRYPAGPVVQWIEQVFPKYQIQVRSLAGLLLQCEGGVYVRREWIAKPTLNLHFDFEWQAPICIAVISQAARPCPLRL
jgi:hypothetical protein